jgi:hypothetical protein
MAMKTAAISRLGGWVEHGQEIALADENSSPICFIAQVLSQPRLAVIIARPTLKYVCGRAKIVRTLLPKSDLHHLRGGTHVTFEVAAGTVAQRNGTPQNHVDDSHFGA